MNGESYTLFNQPSTPYNMIDAMYSRGAHFAIGWNVMVDEGDAQNWDKAFMQDAANGFTISDCLTYANT